jgi:FkbM family methyltransferase
MTIFDVGANTGLTTIQFSQLVGPTGRVYAFEPDRTIREYLVNNLRDLGITNVTVVDIALGGSTGEAEFNMDGTLAAGLVEYSIYTDTNACQKVKTMTLPDFCARHGCVPDFLKADIEGAEVDLVRAALDFLEANPIHLAFESEHKLKEGGLSYVPLEALLRGLNYDVETSPQYGVLCT